MADALRGLNRFGLGARPGEQGRVGDDVHGWLRAQLAAGAPVIPVPVSHADVSRALHDLRAAAAGGEQPRQAARQRLVRLSGLEQRTSLTERVRSERPFVERLVSFWSNHLCIAVQSKPQVQALAGSYERDVVRAHVLGRFEDLVLASARHPAMLFYLDNFQSVGPASPGARVAPRQRQQVPRRGLNENYARELLELHTLGVDGGYTQGDVVELSRALTGWTVDAATVRFMFRDLLHEPGTRTLLGRSYAQRGEAQAGAMIRDLCHHPATARFIATKLVRHFVDDAPPAAAVDRVAQVFVRSEGDLRAVADVLVGLPEAWEPERRKFRTPQDWLVAAMRALNAPVAADALGPLLRQLRHPLWAPPSPKGYGDLAREWADPDSLLNRAELARTLTRRGPARSTEPHALLDVVHVAAGDALHALLHDTSIPADERVALALASPAFQWR